MTDVFSKNERSRIMSLIKAKNTKLETDFLKELSAKFYPRGIRYRKHYAKLAGKPDIVFVSQKLAIFIDSDFWHGRKFLRLKKRLPKRYWLAKITANIRRDKKVTANLRKSGWQVLRFWGSDLKKDCNKAIARIEYSLKIDKEKIKPIVDRRKEMM